MSLFTIVWRRVENKGETFDDDENFTGHDTEVKIHTSTGNTAKMIYIIVEDIRSTSADYGDGVTSAEVIAVFEETTKEDFTGMFTRVE